MKRAISAVLLAIPAVILAGCTSKSVSRVYQADMDTTWAAVLTVAERVGCGPPQKADREKGRIVTRWTTGDVSSRPIDIGTSTTTVEILRGVISCKPDQGGTKVSVKVQMAEAETTSVTGASGKMLSIPRLDPVWALDTDWQKDFLSEVGQELARNQQQKTP